jgi:hypothetical protein
MVATITTHQKLPRPSLSRWWQPSRPIKNYPVPHCRDGGNHHDPSKNNPSLIVAMVATITTHQKRPRPSWLWWWQPSRPIKKDPVPHGCGGGNHHDPSKITPSLIVAMVATITTHQKLPRPSWLWWWLATHRPSVTLLPPFPVPSYTHRVRVAPTHGGNETCVILYPKTHFFFDAIPGSYQILYGAHSEEPARIE